MSSRSDPQSTTAVRFVGRRRQLAEIDRLLASALGGRGRLVLVTGEPGIGKTALAREVARRATDRGAGALWGRCWEGGGTPAYWPWTQVLRAAARLESAGERLRPFRDRLARLMPELSSEGAEPPERGPLDLHEAFVGVLSALSGDRPLVLVLDDLHTADRSSLELLCSVARELTVMRVLLVATYRELELGRLPESARALRPVAKLGRSFPLDGFDAGELEEYLSSVLELPLPEELRDEMLLRTEGNPFLVQELVRMLPLHEGARWLSPGALSRLAVPAGVGEIIGRRLSPLSVEGREALTVAAVLGREFSLSVLARVSGTDRDRLRALLDEAEAAQLIVPSGSDKEGREFSHALVQDTLYRETPIRRRTELHGRCAAALESLAGESDGATAAEIAHHRVENARGGGDVDGAVEACIRAARQALRMVAFGEAAAHFRSALDLLSVAHGSDPVRRAELLLALGDAQARAGSLPLARETFREAAGVARRLRSGSHLARAALGIGGFQGGTPGVIDSSLLDLLEEALAALDPGENVLRSRLLGRKAAELYWASVPETTTGLAAAAVQYGRRSGHVPTLGYALSIAHYARCVPGFPIEERAVLAEEIRRLGRDHNRPELEYRGLWLQLLDFYEAGEMRSIDAALPAMAASTSGSRNALNAWYAAILRTSRAGLEGRYDKIPELLEQMREAGRHISEAMIALYLTTSRALLQIERGDAAGAEQEVRLLIDAHPALRAPRALLVCLYLAAGYGGKARSEYEYLAARDFADVPRDATWSGSMALLATAAARLGDARRGAILATELRAPAARNFCMGIAGPSFGSGLRYLGLAEHVSGRLEEARQQLEAAVDHNRRMKAWPWLARTLFDLGVLLLEIEGEAAAESSVQESREIADRLGMVFLLRQIEAWTSRRSRQRPGRLSGRPGHGPSIGRFCREGRRWLVEYQGFSAPVRDCKGLRDLARLLGRPGEDVDALLLTEGETRTAGARLQVEHLRSEIEEADLWGDADRSGALRSRLEALVDSLAWGQQGMVRERARKSVTNRIRSAIERIREVHPKLAEHLSRSIRTGAVCRYAPGARMRWEIVP